MLLLIALVSFIVIGTAMAGLLYIVRALGLSAEYYGAAESALGFAAILGSIAAGLTKICHLSIVLAVLGAFLIPAGGAFLAPISTIANML